MNRTLNLMLALSLSGCAVGFSGSVPLVDEERDEDIGFFIEDSRAHIDIDVNGEVSSIVAQRFLDQSGYPTNAGEELIDRLSQLDPATVASFAAELGLETEVERDVDELLQHHMPPIE